MLIGEYEVVVVLGIRELARAHGPYEPRLPWRAQLAETLWGILIAEEEREEDRHKEDQAAAAAVHCALYSYMGGEPTQLPTGA